MNLFLAVVSGSHVAPMLVVMLVHCSTPFSMIMTQFVHPRGACYGLGHIRSQTQQQQEEVGRSFGGLTKQQLIGSTLILLSTTAAALPVILPPLLIPNDSLMRLSFLPTNETFMTACSTLMFIASCIPAAASQLYKQQTISSFAQPIDGKLLNWIISCVSLAFAVLISPLIYSLQGIAAGTDESTSSWVKLYPSRDLSRNFLNSIKCLTGTLSEEIQESGYPEEAECNFAWVVMLLHVWSILTIQHAPPIIYYPTMFTIGGSVGYWAVLLTTTTEQFGTNLCVIDQVVEGDIGVDCCEQEALAI